MKISRVVVIDHTENGEGIVYEEYFDRDVEISYDYQDEGKTLKVFIKEQE